MTNLKATFYGGELNGVTMTVAEIIVTCDIQGYTEAFSRRREELRNKPIVDGYYPPMWDGDGLRYETGEVYRALSN